MRDWRAQLDLSISTTERTLRRCKRSFAILVHGNGENSAIVRLKEAKTAREHPELRPIRIRYKFCGQKRKRSRPACSPVASCYCSSSSMPSVGTPPSTSTSTEEVCIISLVLTRTTTRTQRFSLHKYAVLVFESRLIREHPWQLSLPLHGITLSNTEGRTRAPVVVVEASQ